MIDAKSVTNTTRKYCNVETKKEIYPAWTKSKMPLYLPMDQLKQACEALKWDATTDFVRLFYQWFLGDAY